MKNKLDEILEWAKEVEYNDLEKFAKELYKVYAIRRNKEKIK